MRWTTIIFVLIVVARTGSASDPAATERFDAAVSHMDAGDWHAAADGFRSLIDAGIVSGPILLNLATSLENTGSIGEARWALARAERDSEVSETARRRGTALDRRLSQTSIAPGSTRPLTRWIWIAGLMVLGSGLLGAVYNHRFRSGIWIGAIAIALAIGASAIPQREPAIVLTDAIAFPDHQTLGRSELTLTEGQFVRLISRRGARAEVQTIDGVRGWVDDFAVRAF